MSNPPSGTVLQVQCGSCLKIVNVPANFLDQLLMFKMYNCPHCKSRQSINLAPQQETTLRFQARQMMQAEEAARQQQQQRAAATQLAAIQLAAAAASAQAAPQAGGAAQLLRCRLRPALPHSASGSGLTQMQQLLQQHHQKQDAQPAAAAAAAVLQQQQLELLRQIQEKHAKAMSSMAAGGAGAGQMGHFLPLTNEPSPEEEDDADDSEVRDTFMEYKPAKLSFGRPHPDAVVETASLAAVEPPDITYHLKAYKALVDSLSALQLESVVYACQRHLQMLPDGSRGGFFIGDGAGVGKGRTIAGLILENWQQGRHKHLWLSVGSDLKIDTQRDLNDVGAEHLPLHALNKLPYGKLAGHKIGVKEGVIFLTYSSLISSSDRGHTRFKQLIEWCGKDFDGLIVFDESHKAKNLVPEAGLRATQVGLKVRELQLQLPMARVVYCSATGASEPRNMGYMVRLGLWGEGNPAFRDFPRFLDAVQVRVRLRGKGGSGGGSMAALELVAMDMKAQGMYVCRTLSFAGAEFETVEAPLEEPIASQYTAAAATWNQLFREFLYAEELAAAAAGDGGAAPSGTTTGEGGRRRGGDHRSMTWRSFWAGHQAFFRHMTMAAKVPAVVRMAQAAVANGKCAVIGLQSTGEARTADVVADRGEELDDFVSGPKELLIRLVENYYPLPRDPNAEEDEADSDSDEDFQVAAVAEAVARNALEGRDQVYRGAKARAVRYREWSESEDIGDSSSGDDDSGGSSSASDSGVEGEQEGEEDGSMEVVLDGEDTETAGGRRSGQPTSGASSADANGGVGTEGEASGSGGKGRRGQRRPNERGRRRGGRREGGSGGSGDDDSGEEYDPIAKRASATSSSSSGSSGSEDEALNMQQKEQRRQQRRMAAELKAARLEQAAAAYQAALKRKAVVMAAVQQLELPSNPLDTLIDQLGGPAKVAEMTGRKGRLVRSKSSGGVVYEPRNASGVSAGATLEMINVHERELFLGGQKLIAIISEAASAGISLHADLRAANQRRRVHLTLELPWSADKAIQQFGRTHRANQAHGPQYRLIFTPLGGERRFAAAVARRLESLGALTQGDRRAGPSLSAFNYESVWGQRALREMYRAIMLESRSLLALPQPCRPGPSGEAPPLSLGVFLGKARALLLNVGIIRHNKAVVSASHINEYLSRPDGAPSSVGRIDEKDMADVPRFLNRLLGLEPVAQQTIFDFYQVTLEALMDKARREGALDEGIVDIKAHGVSLVGEPRVLHRDATTGATTVMYEVELDRGLPWQDAEQKLEEHRQALALAEAGLAAPGSGAAVPAVVASIPAPPDAGDGEQQQQQQQQLKEEEEQQEQQEGVRQEQQQEELERSQQPSGGSLPSKQQQPDEDEQKREASPGGAGAAVKQEPEKGEAAKPESAAMRRKKRQRRPGKQEATEPAAAEAERSPAKRRRSNGTAAGEEAPPAAAAKSAAKQEEQQADADMIDLTLSDSEGDAKATGKKQGSDDAEVEVVEAADATPARAGGKRRWESGFYRARQEGINRQVHVMLALQELKARYQPLEPAACRPLWNKAYEAAGAAPKEGKKAGVLRKKRLHILGGAVMHSWGVVQQAMVRHVKSSERRMRVLRIATTGEHPLRLVGMLIPDPAVGEVVEQLQQKEAEEEEKKKQAAEAADARGSDGSGASEGADAEGSKAVAVAAQAGPGGRARGRSKRAVTPASGGRGRGGGLAAQQEGRRQQPARGRTRQQQAEVEDEEETTEEEVPQSSGGNSSDDEASSSEEEEEDSSGEASSERTESADAASGGAGGKAAAPERPRHQPRRGRGAAKPSRAS
ncbi:hypothetical protein CHLNCDRAFT_137726 [Chlorella variabilis]|uniref:Uncharacterized protein n=1 Tax=Chlorella variabilis TaxID=554065 RepID=E1Z4C8_CHLVA|nr:hypothetical protein CHLNCDRAFT_137726 [Chlorella variabilis]EFN59033.1 hypothetical protein CHLNCDRAFT_137726 [Chlorella variabilis]|eukprot:XP_005851135.1 hypothetical protein CHLNCDRAFT_137726 [Chlorella variabilis]